jgi:hypothetical protein
MTAPDRCGQVLGITAAGGVQEANERQLAQQQPYGEYANAMGSKIHNIVPNNNGNKHWSKEMFCRPLDGIRWKTGRHQTQVSQQKPRCQAKPLRRGVVLCMATGVIHLSSRYVRTGQKLAAIFP